MERRERMAWHFAGKYDPLADPLDVADNLGWRCDFCGAIIPPSHFQDVNFGNRSGFWVRSYNCDCPAAVASRHALEAMQQAASDAAAQIARDHQLRTAGVTEQQTFATFRPRPDWPELMDKCSTVAEYSQALLNGSLAPRNWLVLMGNYGTGKTHLAAACVMAALEARRGAYFRNWPKYLERLRASWDWHDSETPRESERDILAELNMGWLVVLDDVDKANNEGAQRALYSFLNERYRQHYPTILTLNTMLPDDADANTAWRVLSPIFGGALVDRLFEVTWKMVKFDGPSYRSGLSRF